MKKMKNMLVALIAVMFFVLVTPAVFAEEMNSEPQPVEKVVHEVKAEESKAKITAEEPRAEEVKSEEPKAEEPKTEEIKTPDSAVEIEKEADPEVTARPEADQELEVTEATIERSVQVVASESCLATGETLKLTAKLSGFDGVQYKLNWQVKEQGGEWKNISGEHGETLKVEMTTENIGSAWRVTAEIAD